MTSELRLAAVLFGSLLLWSPALTAFLAGDLDVGTVGVRYAGSLALASVAVAGLEAVARGYRSEPASEADSGASGGPGRRIDDAAPAGEPAREGDAEDHHVVDDG